MADYPRTPSADFRWNCLPYVFERIGESCWYRPFGRNYLDLGDHREPGSVRPTSDEWIKSGGMLLHISKKQRVKLARLGCHFQAGGFALYTDGTTPPYAWDRYQKILGYVITLKSNCNEPTAMRKLLRQLSGETKTQQEVAMFKQHCADVGIELGAV